MLMKITYLDEEASSARKKITIEWQKLKGEFLD